MRTSQRLLVLTVLFAAVMAPTGSAVGAAGYDFSNPSSTGCVTRGPLTYPATTRAYGVWSISLRRSTGCNTVWAHITRTDTKRCLTSGQYCAKIRVTRVLNNGTKTATALRAMPHGTKAVLSFQLNGTNRSVFTANAATVGGRAIGASGHLSVDANGNWTSS